MATFNKLNCFAQDCIRGIHHWNSDVIYIALTNTAPTVNTTKLSDITQIAQGNGYTTNGFACSMGDSDQADGVCTLEMTADVTVLAAGGDMATWRYAFFYNYTNADKKGIGWLDYGSALTLLNGSSVVIQTDGTRGTIS